MVGRMEGQSVVLRAEKGRLRLSVADEHEDKVQEVIYNLNEERHDNGEDGAEGKKGDVSADSGIFGGTEMHGGIVDMDGAANGNGNMSGTVDTVDGALSQWQKRAMEGMLQALEPRVNLDKGAVLSPRLQAMLTKRLLTVGEGKLQSRLAKVQGVKTEKKDEPVLKDEKKP